MKSSSSMIAIKKHMGLACLPMIGIVALGAMFSLSVSASEVALEIAADGTKADFLFTANASARELLLGYGTSDAGTDTNAWANVVKLADVPAGVTALSNVALPAGCGTTWTVARAFLPREVTSSDYVQDGLVLQYDAKDNAGSGLHETSLSQWKDLIGSNDLPLDSEDVVSADFVKISTNAHWTAGNVVDSYKAMTFEAYTRFDSLSPSGNNNKNVYYGTLLAIPHIGEMGYWGTYGSYMTKSPQPNLATGWRRVWNGPWALGGVARAGWRSWSVYLAKKQESTGGTSYINGSTLTQNTGIYKQITWPEATELKLQVGGNNSTTNVTVNSFRSIRLYDRELTADEVVYNRTIDLARYEGGTFPAPASEPAYAAAPLEVSRTSMGNGAISAAITFGASAKVRRLYVAYATSDMGSETNLYTGCDYVCDIAAGTTSATVAFPASAASWLSVRGGYRLFMEVPPMAGSYVTNGLVLLYDATENAGRGFHVTASSAWKDLIGSNDLPLDSEDVVSADFVKISTNAHWTAGNVVDSYKAMTFEAYTRMDSLSPAGNNNKNVYFGTLLAIPHIGEMGYWGTWGSYITKSPQPNLATGWRRVWNGPWALGGVAQAGWRSWSVYLAKKQESTGGTSYINGSTLTQNTGIYEHISWPAATERRLQVSGNTSTTNVTVNSFRSIRLYDRELSSDEVAYNRTIDLARYEGGASPLLESSDFIKIQRAMVLMLR